MDGMAHVDQRCHFTTHLSTWCGEQKKGDPSWITGQFLAFKAMNDIQFSAHTTIQYFLSLSLCFRTWSVGLESRSTPDLPDCPSPARSNRILNVTIIPYLLKDWVGPPCDVMNGMECWPYFCICTWLDELYTYIQVECCLRNLFRSRPLQRLIYVASPATEKYEYMPAR